MLNKEQVHLDKKMKIDAFLEEKKPPTSFNPENLAVLSLGSAEYNTCKYQ